MEQKTIFDHLLMLPKQYISKAITNTEESKLKQTCFSIQEALMSAFEWDKTIEGSKYWQNVLNEIEGNKNRNYKKESIIIVILISIGLISLLFF